MKRARRGGAGRLQNGQTSQTSSQVVICQRVMRKLLDAHSLAREDGINVRTYCGTPRIVCIENVRDIPDLRIGRKILSLNAVRMLVPGREEAARKQRARNGTARRHRRDNDHFSSTRSPQHPQTNHDRSKGYHAGQGRSGRLSQNVYGIILYFHFRNHYSYCNRPTS